MTLVRVLAFLTNTKKIHGFSKARQRAQSVRRQVETHGFRGISFRFAAAGHGILSGPSRRHKRSKGEKEGVSRSRGQRSEQVKLDRPKTASPSISEPNRGLDGAR